MAWLYDLSFSFFVIITGAAVLASGVSLILPALFSSSNTADPDINWNVIAIIGSYVAIAIVSLGIYLSRKITTNQKLRSIPKKLVANKQGDVPAIVASLVAVEYDRACAVVHISQPSAVHQEGWGAPGSEFEGIQFRRAMMDSLATLDATARVLVPTFPNLKPHQSAEAHLKSLEGILNRNDPQCLTKYSGYIQQARYAEQEPSLEDFEACMRLHLHMQQILRLLQTGPKHE